MITAYINGKFVGRFTVGSDLKKVAADMRGALELSSTDRAECADYEAFIKHLVSRAEGLGILVMRSALVGHDTQRKLDVKEFRGFALSDPLAPVVFINDADAKAAQVFTIAHEMVHIWIGEDGVSDRTPNQKKESTNKIELFCDQVAAELLVPEAEFNKVWKDGPVKTAAQSTARHFRVSTLVALRRAKDLNRIDFDSFMARDPFPMPGMMAYWSWFEKQVSAGKITSHKRVIEEDARLGTRTRRIRTGPTRKGHRID
jgi:Zn-dependent peptidase ImmA (M78 family)